MFNPMKKFAIATLIAVSAGTAVFAAPGVTFDPANMDGAVTVSFNDSTDTTLSVDASRLFDANQLIRLNYGFDNLGSILKIKEVMAPEGIGVTFTDVSEITAQDDLTNTDGSSRLSLALTVSNANGISGSFPVQVVLENTATGETTTLNLMVQTNP
jgi:hypothetical protein